MIIIACLSYFTIFIPYKSLSRPPPNHEKADLENKSLAMERYIALCWVPDHTGIQGYEHAVSSF